MISRFIRFLYVTLILPNLFYYKWDLGGTSRQSKHVQWLVI